MKWRAVATLTYTDGPKNRATQMSLGRFCSLAEALDYAQKAERHWRDNPDGRLVALSLRDASDEGGP